MPSAATQQQATWLLENGPRELEALLRAIIVMEAENQYTDSWKMHLRS